MVGKVIEKTYKYTIQTPNELFEVFKEKFSEATLPDSWRVSEPWTTTILSIFNEIGRGNLKRVKEPKPKLQEQQKIAKILSTIDKKLEFERNEKAKLERIKQGMMDLLLSGKIRIKVN